MPDVCKVAIATTATLDKPKLPELSGCVHLVGSGDGLVEGLQDRESCEATMWQHYRCDLIACDRWVNWHPPAVVKTWLCEVGAEAMGER